MAKERAKETLGPEGTSEQVFFPLALSETARTPTSRWERSPQTDALRGKEKKRRVRGFLPFSPRFIRPSHDNALRDED